MFDKSVLSSILRSIAKDSSPHRKKGEEDEEMEYGEVGKEEEEEKMEEIEAEGEGLEKPPGLVIEMATGGPGLRPLPVPPEGKPVKEPENLKDYSKSKKPSVVMKMIQLHLASKKKPKGKMEETA